MLVRLAKPTDGEQLLQLARAFYGDDGHPLPAGEAARSTLVKPDSGIGFVAAGSCRKRLRPKDLTVRELSARD